MMEGGGRHVKRKMRIVIDIVMTCLLPMLMAYSLIGEQFHEIIGTLMLALFIIHHMLNRKWYGALSKGRCSGYRVFQILLDFLLLFLMIIQPASGILMSKHLYTFLPALPVSAAARAIHLPVAFWSFVLMNLHAGTHLSVCFTRLRKRKKCACNTLLAILGIISAYGIYAFIRRGFPGYLFLKTAFAFFDYSEPRAFFFLDYLAIMVLFLMLGCLISCGLGQIHTKRKMVV